MIKNLFIMICGFLLSEVSEGMVLISDPNFNKASLVDTDQNINNVWGPFDDNLLNSYLTTDGILVAIFKSENNNSTIFQKLDWNSNIIWEYTMPYEVCAIHHQQTILPNGNILAVCRETINAENNIYMNIDLDIDKVIEIESVNENEINIVWEWRFYDHLIQDFDPYLDGFGVISENPQLLDIGLSSMGSFSHINCIDYNDELDQVIMSSRTRNEVYVIDHSTTTEEAASHTGGRYNMGGDILYRWGNPINYDRGDQSDQKLFSPHGVNWIKTGFPGGGNILLFNNNHSDLLSAVVEFQPPISDDGTYSLVDSLSYGPDDFTWINQSSYYAQTNSGAIRMPNGNTFITSYGDQGSNVKIFEIDYNGIIQWEYLGNLISKRAIKYHSNYLNPILMGDINNDGLINILDIVQAVSLVLESDYQSVIDLNYDGSVDVLDIVIIINMVLEI